jgi:hypothetical protein
MKRTLLFSAACLLNVGLFAQVSPSSSFVSQGVEKPLVIQEVDFSLQAQPKLPAAPLVAQGVDRNFQSKEQEVDMDALRRWLQDKRLVSLKELGGDLSISGEVRSEVKYTSEKLKAQGGSEFIQQRGMNSATARPSLGIQGRPSLAWDVEFNLMLDYHTDRTWAAMKVEFDNVMGTRSGTANRVKLEKAYLGGRIIAQDTFTWDAEIGRRYLGNIYDSKLQFGSLFDGALLRFSKAFQEIGDFYTNVGAFAININANHYGEVVEMGALKIANTPFNMRYSVINWYRHYSQTDLQNGTAQLPGAEFTQPWRYLVNQYTIFYQAYPTWFNKRLFKVYAAGLWNAIAKKVPQTGGKKANFGFYTGISMGTVKKDGDWAIDVNYQWAQAQVAPPIDCSGIGRGNAGGAGFFTTGEAGSGLITTQANAFSPFDYQGFEVDALYAFTSNLTMQQHFAWSWTLDKDIGPDDITKQYEVEFIYAF